jgi:hypothetical protein
MAAVLGIPESILQCPRLLKAVPLDTKTVASILPFYQV